MGKKDKFNSLSDLGGLVYSTNKNENLLGKDEEIETLQPSEQQLKVWFEKKGRGGKMATVIRGFIGSEDDLKLLEKDLKSKIGTGGSSKDGEIIIQGNHQNKVWEYLSSKGFKAKKAGG